MAQSPLPCADLSPPPAWCPTAGTARQALRAPPLPPVLFLLLLTTHQRLAPQPSHCSACLPPFLHQWTERGRCFLPVSPLLPRSCPHWLPRAGRCLPLAVPHPELPSRIAFTPRPTMADGGWGPTHAQGVGHLCLDLPESGLLILLVLAQRGPLMAPSEQPFPAPGPLLSTSCPRRVLSVVLPFSRPTAHRLCFKSSAMGPGLWAVVSP